MGSRPPQKPKNFFTRAEVAQLFEVAPNTVNRWVLAGRLPSVLTPGGRRRYPAGAIRLMLDEQMLGAGAYALEEESQGQVRSRGAGALQPGRAPHARARELRVGNRSRRK